MRWLPSPRVVGCILGMVSSSVLAVGTALMINWWFTGQVGLSRWVLVLRYGGLVGAVGGGVLQRLYLHRVVSDTGFNWVEKHTLECWAGVPQAVLSWLTRVPDCGSVITPRYNSPLAAPIFWVIFGPVGFYLLDWYYARRSQ